MMIAQAIYETITELYPDEKWRYQDVTPALDLSNLKFESGFVPDKAKVQEVFDVKIVEVEANKIATQYQIDRQYPSTGDQLDMLMKDMKNGTTTHQEACEAVKAKYPKP